jgi:hypothetical protein
MQTLLDQLHDLQASPPTVAMLKDGNRQSWSRHEKDKPKLQQILRQTEQLFDDICRAVDQGHLNPSRKHAEALSRLVECVLYNYSCCCNETAVPSNKPKFPVSQKCQRVLKILKKEWNLDIQSSHYQHAIAVANLEENYSLASDLFEQQIDPNAGRTPVPVAIDNPQGLFAIAMLHSPPNNNIPEEVSSSAAAEHVMDAVQRLIMVSPHDQTTYLLAAGNALGYAGRWQDLVEYWKSSFLSQQYGTPLVAAVMQACWLCRRPDQAWQVLQDSKLLVVNSNSSSSLAAASTTGFGGEWQYGGERDLMDPLVRDVAMKVVTSFQPPSDETVTEIAPSVSQVALDLYHQSQQEGTTISLDALTGVVQACEQDGKWQQALSIVWSVLDETKDIQKSWIASGNHLLIEERDRKSSSAGQYETQQQFLWDVGDLLASVMRSCNSSSNFGISLFLLTLLQSRVTIAADDVVSSDPPGAPLLSQLRASEEVLASCMVALCGLRCYENAIDLIHTQGEAADSSVPLKMVHEYAKSSQARFGTLVLGNPWTSAQRHIQALTKFVNERRNGGNLSKQEQQHVLQVLAAAMNSSTNAHQPELSLQLFRWIDQEFFQSSMEKSSSVTVGQGLLKNDSVTAEYIMALRWANDFSGATSMLEKCIEQQANDLSGWRKTLSAGLAVMMAGGRGNDAVKVFEALDEEALSTECYTTIGRHLSKNAQWKELINLYRDGVAQGFGSEELSFMAMHAVTSTRIDNRLRILRAIVAECASEVGLDPQTWVTRRYWQIKRELGFDYARLLMWWNDPERATLDELILAIKEFDNEVANELRPKNDVLRVIVKGASLLDAMQLETVEGYERVPKTVSQWVSLLDDVLSAIQDSPIHSDPNFIDSVVQAYKSLGCSRECIHYIQGIMDSDNVRLRKSTLREVLEAARMEQAMELSKDVQMLLMLNE